MAISFTEPANKKELFDSLLSVHSQATAFWNGFSMESFFAPFEDKWSPAENVLHLNKSTRPVATALRLPTIIPRLLFGHPKAVSRSYAQVQHDYLQVLGQGGQAGKYAPKRHAFPENPQQARGSIMLQWDDAWQRLIRNAIPWDDRSLDRICLPHPLLGKLSVREMLYFTLYHHLHHLKIVANRPIYR